MCTYHPLSFEEKTLNLKAVDSSSFPIIPNNTSYSIYSYLKETDLVFEFRVFLFECVFNVDGRDYRGSMKKVRLGYLPVRICMMLYLFLHIFL
jgi:hypothetical protein